MNCVPNTVPLHAGGGGGTFGGVGGGGGRFGLVVGGAVVVSGYVTSGFVLNNGMICI